MKTLLLLRHAKSSWKHPELDDHDRPLNKRGKRTAPIMGTSLQDEDLIPDLILCSSAVRAYTTALLVAKACAYKGEIEQTLYGKKEDPASLLSLIPSESLRAGGADIALMARRKTKGSSLYMKLRMNVMRFTSRSMSEVLPGLSQLSASRE